MTILRLPVLALGLTTAPARAQDVLPEDLKEFQTELDEEVSDSVRFAPMA